NLPISPVPPGVRRVISQNIVTLGIFADRFKNLAQVVCIQNGLTAGVQCQSSQGLLRVGDGCILIPNGLAAVVGCSRGAPFAGIAAGWRSNESSSIDAIE